MFLRQLIQMYPENSVDWVVKGAQGARAQIDTRRAELGKRPLRPKEGADMHRHFGHDGQRKL